MTESLPPDHCRRRPDDAGPPTWLKAIVLALGVASLELTLELALFGPGGANPWVSVALLCLTYLGVTGGAAWRERRRADAMHGGAEGSG